MKRQGGVKIQNQNDKLLPGPGRGASGTQRHVRGGQGNEESFFRFHQIPVT